MISDAGQAQRQLADQSKRLATKWDQSGLLDGLSKYEKNGMAVLLENQAGQLMNEASTTNPTAGTDAENWAGVALPLVRKVLGQVASKNFVSVQPMSLPAGLVFFLEFEYGTAAGGRSVGDSIYGITSGSGAIPRDGMYGTGRFGYTINEATLGSQTDAAIRVATPSDVQFESTGSTTTYSLYQVSSSVFTRPDLHAIRSWTISGSGVDFGATHLPQYTRLNDGTSTIQFVAASGSSEITTYTYSQQPVDNNRGDFEDRDPFSGSGSDTGIDDGTDIGIPEINIEMRSEPIVAKTRKLKAVWTPELAQDLNAFHSVDAEAELTNMLSDYISLEIDLEILDMLIVNAQTTDYWSAEIGSLYNPTSRTFANASFVGTAWTNMTWFQTLGQKMQKMSNQIHKLTMRGGANFAVCSPTVATILETIPGFTADTDGTKMEFAAGVSKIGSFNNRFQIYKNPYMIENIMLMGFRGSNFLETGAVYAPYIPLIMTPLVYDPINFTPRRGVMTRYAKKMVRPEFFGKIIIAGLESI